MGSFDGKVAFVTGAGSGIARVTAGMFAAEGAQVVLAEINDETGKANEKAIRDAGGEALFVKTDVTSEESVRNAVAAAVGRYGRLDILHNCAGGSVLEDGVVTDVDLKVWEHTINLDLKGTFLCCRYALPEIVKSGGGAVINMTSALALMGGPSRNVYATAKGGIISLTRTLAAEFTHKGVRVNAIAPSSIRTERSIRKYGSQPFSSDASTNPYRARLAERYPYSRGMPEDVGHIVLFLASDKSRLINGAVIPADGGRSAYL